MSSLEDVQSGCKARCTKIVFLDSWSTHRVATCVFILWFGCSYTIVRFSFCVSRHVCLWFSFVFFLQFVPLSRSSTVQSASSAQIRFFVTLGCFSREQLWFWRPTNLETHSASWTMIFDRLLAYFWPSDRSHSVHSGRCKSMNPQTPSDFPQTRAWE